MPIDYLDDFVCNITCEEYFRQDLQTLKTTLNDKETTNDLCDPGNHLCHGAGVWHSV